MTYADGSTEEHVYYAVEEAEFEYRPGYRETWGGMYGTAVTPDEGGVIVIRLALGRPKEGPAFTVTLTQPAKADPEPVRPGPARRAMRRSRRR